jgi:hypothetical protein
MSKTYTITSDQVSNIHNAGVYLSDALREAEELFKADSYILKNLKSAVRELEPVRKDVVGRKDKDWDQAYTMFERIRALNNFNYSIWSIYEVENMTLPSCVPAGSKLKSFYTDSTVVVEGQTWLDLWKATNDLIKQSSDEHGGHVFIEAFRKTNTDGVYEVILGS